MGIGEGAYRNPAKFRGLVAFPEDVASAVRAEVKADGEPAVGYPRINLVLTFGPHLAFQPAGAEMECGPRAALARLAVAEVNPVRFARGDDLERAAMALRRSFQFPLRV